MFQAPVVSESNSIVPSTRAPQTEVVGSDVLIPRLLLMQGISPLVTSRKAQIGDIVRSTTGQKLGDPEKPIHIVPISMVSSWLNFQEMEQGQPKYRGMEKRYSANEHSPWEYTGEGGVPMFRRKAVMLYALIPSDVEHYEKEIAEAIASGEMPDLNKTVLPVVLTFQSTSFKYAGRKCATFFNMVAANAKRVPGLVPYGYSMELICREEKNGTNSWYVFDFGKSASLKNKAITEEASRWASILSAGAVKMDAEEEFSTSVGTTSDEI